MSSRSTSAAALSALGDAELATRIAGQDQAAFEVLMRRHNTRLFRVARAILRDDAEAEDALQDAYLDAYRHIGEFRGGAQLGTWLTRVVINHSLMRYRKQKRDRVVVPIGPHSSLAPWRPDGVEGGQREAEMRDDRAELPVESTLRAEIRRILERRIDQLPTAFRTVFVMRDVEDMSVQETADALGIPPATVRTRLFRARALLREGLARDMDIATSDVFRFAGERCDRIVAGVLADLRSGNPSFAKHKE
jgi:RNA polymerase sigma-70 factor (ECF subfamily)